MHHKVAAFYQRVQQKQEKQTNKKSTESEEIQKATYT